MSAYSRAAIGSSGKSTSSLVTWALAGLLERQGLQVQHFFSRACYCGLQGGLTTTGVASRHFDTWLMTRDECRARLAEAYRTADIVLVEGRFELSHAEEADVRPPSACDGIESGGNLEVLARRLDLPRLYVLDAAAAADGCFGARPDAVDGILLDDVRSAHDFARLQVSLEGAWGVPVLGGLMADHDLRRQLGRLPPGAVVPAEMCISLVDSLERMVDLRQLQAAIARSSVPTAASMPQPIVLGGRAPVIAVAYDEAFCGYFADTLESLERLGAKVVDFSPLADEGLPEGVDVVLLGCGRPDRHAEALSANHCFKASLRDFARHGGRIYAEGGGLAYLGRWITAGDGRAYPMVDLFPLASHRASPPQAPQAVEFAAEVENWLAPKERKFRAYRSRAWVFDALDQVERLCGDSDDLLRSGEAIGGRLQLHLAAQPALLARLLSTTAPRQAVQAAEVGAPT
jgi:cobyrinic acid a,c-diamide synthase